ncbi:MAG: DUF2459 domain-containing protein [Chloroflexota bacterium]
MQAIKFLWKFLLRAFAAFCLFLTSYILIGEYLGNLAVNTDFEPDPNGIEIFIISNGVHTDIAVPTVTDQKDWTEMFDPATFKPPIDNAVPSYIAFGWGDRGLYENVPTWGDLTFQILFTSMLLPTTSAVHVSYFIDRPKETPNAIAVKISREQYDMLIEEVLATLILEDGKPQSLNCCFFPNFRDQFYGSPFSYHIFYTCNMWTNEILKKIGLPAARWATRQNYIMSHLRQFDSNN